MYWWSSYHNQKFNLNTVQFPSFGATTEPFSIYTVTVLYAMANAYCELHKWVHYPEVKPVAHIFLQAAEPQQTVLSASEAGCSSFSSFPQPDVLNSTLMR